MVCRVVERNLAKKTVKELTFKRATGCDQKRENDSFFVLPPFRVLKDQRFQKNVSIENANRVQVDKGTKRWRDKKYKGIDTQNNIDIYNQNNKDIDNQNSIGIGNQKIIEIQYQNNIGIDNQSTELFSKWRK